MLRLFLRRNLEIPGIQGQARVLVIHPSGRNSSSGPYLQALATALGARGHAMLMMGEKADHVVDGSVTWLPFRQWRGKLSRKTRDRIDSFRPDVVLLVGVRCRAMLAALEISFRSDLPLFVQLEDDDQVVFTQRYPAPDPALLDMLDTSLPEKTAVDEFSARIDWRLTGKLWAGRYRLVEPVLRALVLHGAFAMGAIWHPMAERMKLRFAKPVLVIPPIIEPPKAMLSSRERDLAAFGVSADRIIIFVSGTIYNHSPEFTVFLQALNRLHQQHHRFALVTTARVHGTPGKSLRQLLDPGIESHMLDLREADSYERMLRAADIVAVPGLADEFNRLRLPARIPRAMILGKPVFTFACGFGASLSDGVNSILTQTGDPQEWASQMQKLFDQGTRERIGEAGRIFAQNHFLADPIAGALSSVLQDARKERARIPAVMEPLKQRVVNFLGL